MGILANIVPIVVYKDKNMTLILKKMTVPLK